MITSELQAEYGPYGAPNAALDTALLNLKIRVTRCLYNRYTPLVVREVRAEVDAFYTYHATLAQSRKPMGDEILSDDTSLDIIRLAQLATLREMLDIAHPIED